MWTTETKAHITLITFHRSAETDGCNMLSSYEWLQTPGLEHVRTI